MADLHPNFRTKGFVLCTFLPPVTTQPIDITLMGMQKNTQHESGQKIIHQKKRKKKGKINTCFCYFLKIICFYMSSNSCTCFVKMPRSFHKKMLSVSLWQKIELTQMPSNVDGYKSTLKNVHSSKRVPRFLLLGQYLSVIGW